jgi:hypothetical protein
MADRTWGRHHLVLTVGDEWVSGVVFDRGVDVGACVRVGGRAARAGPARLRGHGLLRAHRTGANIIVMMMMMMMMMKEVHHHDHGKT